MEPWDRVSLWELRRVLRVAARIHTHERAAEEEARLRAEYLAAAAEVGLTEDHLQRALAEVRASRPRRVPPPMKRAAAAGAASLLSLTVIGVWAARQEAASTSQPATVPVVEVATERPAVVPELEALESYITTRRGLKYRTIRAGTGATAAKGRSATLHYTGYFENSEKFDSSVDRGEPFSFAVGQGECIAGFEEGVPGMKVGEIRRLIIPPQLAYGADGVHDAIPPGATLVFDIELLRVSQKPGS